MHYGHDTLRFGIHLLFVLCLLNRKCKEPILNCIVLGNSSLQRLDVFISSFYQQTLRRSTHSRKSVFHILCNKKLNKNTEALQGALWTPAGKVWFSSLLCSPRVRLLPLQTNSFNSLTCNDWLASPF